MLKYLILFSSLFFLLNSEESYFEIRKFQNDSYKNGKILFDNNCIGCHNPNMVSTSTAPPLGGITLKRNKKWLYNYTRDSYGMYLKGDSIAKTFKGKGWGLMTSFPKLNDQNLDDIYYFVEKRFSERKFKKNK